ncbi:hypothetical protein Mame01_29700 [Microbispora amethystogenes]|nr:hypothetical protein Mame01_29700 [Microbispora amethystogenes]
MPPMLVTPPERGRDETGGPGVSWRLPEREKPDGAGQAAGHPAPDKAVPAALVYLAG